MIKLGISHDTSPFEVRALLDEKGRLTVDCARQALMLLEAEGLVIITDLLSSEEANKGSELVRETTENPDRNHCAFASETDNRFKRRDFCSLPSSPEVIGFVATLCKRLESVLAQYCSRANRLLEVTTLTSYLGSSHQYFHRDPSGVISLFASVENIKEEQGGTVFVPRTQLDGVAGEEHDNRSLEAMSLFQAACNYRILSYNLRNLIRMHKNEGYTLMPGEFRDRVFSTKWDEHQPNLLRFMIGKNSLFSVRDLTPGSLYKLFRQRNALQRGLHIVKTAPRKGSVIIYKSDLLHAGPDNRSPTPRQFFSMSLARELIANKSWYTGYSPHPTLKAAPISFGDLLDYPLTTSLN